MSKLKVFSVILFLLITNYLYSQTTYYSRATGNWNGTVWSTSPTGTAATATINANDNVVIQSSHTITINATPYNCNNLTINSGGTLEFPASGSDYFLNVFGSINGTGTISFLRNNSAFNLYGNYSFTGTWANASIGRVWFSGSGDQNVDANSTATWRALFTDNKVGGTIYFYKTPTLTNAPNLDAGTYTLNYCASGNQSILSGPYIANLVFSGGGIKTLSSNTTVTGSVTVRGGTTLANGGFTLGGAINALNLECGATGSTISGMGLMTLGGNVTVTKIAGTGTGATISCPVALGATRTFTVADEGTSSIDLSVSGIISGTGLGITKQGGGTLSLSGVNTYTGPTTVSSGILELEGTDRISSSSNLVLSGGTFSTGATTGFSETMSTIALTANSTISLGSGDHSLRFSASSSVNWTGTKLTISGWTGSGGKIFIGTSASGLTSGQLAKIVFLDGSIERQATQLSTGEVVPILPAPTNLSYSTPNTFTAGVAITPLNPTVTGVVQSYSITPALPAGLTLNSSTGVISGTPSVLSSTTTYTITATNNGGSTNTTLSIAVIAGPPTRLSINTIGTQTAGATFAVTVNSTDNLGNISNVIANTEVSLSLASGSGLLSGTLTGTILAGTSSITITGIVYTVAETISIAASQTSGTTSLINGTSNSFVVNAAALSTFLVESTSGGDIPTQFAGTAFNIKITAKDAFGNTVTSFTGAGNTVNVTSTGTLSSGGGTTTTFTNGVLSSRSVNISNSGTFTITATRTSGGSQSGTSNSFGVGRRLYAISSAAWNASGTWSTSSGGTSCACIPDEFDNVFIGESATNRTVNIPNGVDAKAAIVEIGNLNDNTVGVLNFATGTSTLVVAQNVIMNRPNAGATSSINVDAGSMLVKGDFRLTNYTANADHANRINSLRISTGTVTINGDLTLGAQHADQSQIVFTSSGILNIGGLFSLSNSLGTLITNNVGTVNFNSSTKSQPIPIGISAIKYNNIIFNNTHSNGATLGGEITSGNVLGNISVQSGVLNNGGFAINLVSGKSFSVSNGARFNLTGTSTMASVSGGGTKSFGITSTVDYAGTNQAVSADTYGNLILSGSGTKTMTGVSTITGDFTMSGDNTTNAATTVTLSVGGNMTVGSGNTLTLTNGNPSLNVTGNTVLSGTVTSPGAAKTFGGSFTINSGGSWTEQADPIYNFAGNFTNNGTFNAGTSTANFNGTTVISGSSNTSFHNITVANGSSLTTPSTSLTATGDVTNNGTINQSSGAVGIVGNLTLGTSSTYQFTGTSTLTLSNDFIISGNGSFIPDNSTLYFTGGSMNAKFQRDAGSQTFNNVIVEKGSSGGDSYYNLNVNTDLSIKGYMKLKSGDVVVKRGSNSANSTGNKILEILGGASISREPSQASANPKVYGSLKIVGSNGGSRGDGSCQVLFPLGGQSNMYQPVYLEYPVCNENYSVTITHFKSSNNGAQDRSFDSEKVLGVSKHEYWEVTPDASTKTAIKNSADGIKLLLTYRTSNANEKYFPTVSHSAPSRSVGHISTSDLSDTWKPLSGLPAFIVEQDGHDKEFNGQIEVSGVKDFSYVTPVVIPNSVNPVQLINFTAKKTPENKVALSWVTASESVNKGFHIERQSASLSGKFESIGFVNTKAQNGNSQANLYYNFMDPLPKAGATSFYRLVQEDLDGTRTNSEVRLVRLDGHSVVLVYPNPSNGNVVINRTDEGKKMNIQVFDQSGRVVKEANNIVESSYKMTLSNPGIYNIKLIHPETGEQSIQRIVIHK